jgi:L,D-peptidoglycan transpeptidase YkuD (ErfK/YbiS/YcfS/YnhG family)
VLATAATVAALALAGCTSPGHPSTAISPTALAPASTPAAAPSPLSLPSSSATSAPSPSAPAATHSSRPSAPRSSSHAAPSTKASSTAALPLSLSTGSATQVITVVATSTARTTATLQAWSKVNGRWTRHGASVVADLGSDGLSSHPSESKSATPIGSFTLTRAFGHDADPGTALPYTHTTPSYWWISQPGKLYNTMQDCATHCDFTQGDPNEHLYYETPFYDYAVVIDYNTSNAGPVRQGAGSAFFLHVSVGAPTAGCVSIPKSNLVSILQWLRPSAHPRILIGVG